MDFKDKLLDSFKEGLYLLVKYGLLIAATWYTFNFSLQTREMSMNGQNAAAYLGELQRKGWLPKIENGQVPDKIIKNAEEKK